MTSMTENPYASPQAEVTQPPTSSKTPIRRMLDAIALSLVAFLFGPVAWTAFWYACIYLPEPARDDYSAPTEFEKFNLFESVLHRTLVVSLVVAPLIFLWKLSPGRAVAKASRVAGRLDDALEKYV